MSLFYDKKMLELLILLKLSDIRQELREEEDVGHQIVFLGVVALLFLWPVALFIWVKKLGVNNTIAFVLTTTVVVWSLMFDWGFFFVIGFLIMLVAAGVIAYQIID